MELIEQLEQRISALLDRLDRLVADNAALKDEHSQEIKALKDENESLRNELTRERSLTTEAVARIESIVARIKDRAGQE
ncbi:MAG: cell division protein ZapB [Desulfovibrio sp.]|jgi:predicted  nucleic acid-binding Zn-ribbon protein|nr:cell division protein ZapB [Desulfovibrio sp.]